MNLKNAIVKAQFLCVLIFYLFFYKSAYGQKDHIIPLSPNAAEITKYGEIPVGNFSGIPNIAIPIYTIKSGDLQLPLNLSYHAGGNKVESIASWVGLAWNLATIPSISRSVNGLPDENVGGFFSLYGGKTIRQIVDERYASPDVYDNLLVESKSGNADTEPDIFSYTLNGASGKFYYSQDLQQFVTIPKSNIKITYTNNNFVILDEQGNKFVFQDTETTTNSSSVHATAVTTNWLITTITNSTNTDNISFMYDFENQYTMGLSGEAKYNFIDGFPNTSGDTSTQPFSAYLTYVRAKRLAMITFKNGYLQFLKSDVEREDLVGGYALKGIKLFNSTNELLKEFLFNYNYITGDNSAYGCLNDSFRSNKWMFLTAMDEFGSTNANSLHHNFTYDTSVYPSCRNSAAQDYWGYYNGANSNTSIIPSAYFNGTSILLPGANRYVNPNYSKFGILTRIDYPTGGYTTFEYENNQTKNRQLPAIYRKETAFIAAQIDQTPDENVEIPSQNTFQTTFEINNPRDQFLNNSQPGGGAYVNANVGELGVPPGTQGAYIRLRGISITNSSIDIMFYENFNSRYLPNGQYELSAVFNQNPPNYQNFHCILDWQVSESGLDSTRYAGGLRIREMKDYTSSNEDPIVKRFKYTEGYNSNISSGDIFGTSDLNFEDVVMLSAWVYSADEQRPVLRSGRYFRQRSYSNQAQVTTAGSYVGYQYVFVETNSPQQTGVTSYEYRVNKDEYSSVFPYVPVQSQDSFRGSMKELSQYKLVNGVLIPVSKSIYEYLDVLNPTPIFGLKISIERPDIEMLPTNELLPLGSPYEFFPTWSAESQKVVTTYDMISNEPVVSETNYTYNGLGYLESEEFATSKSEALVTKKYYPSYISLTGDAEIARLWFLQNNFLNVVLKEESYLRKPNLTDKLISTKQYNFKKFDGLNLIKLNQLVYDQTNSSFPTVQNFDYYNSAGNVLQVSENNGPNTTYIWSYKSQYPIAEIKNADYVTVESILGGATAVNNFAASTPTDTELNAVINNLKNSPLLKNAQISSYTYKALVGMTSSTDAKGMKTYFNYDGFQRLKTIKDQNGNILKQTDYHYKN